MGLFSSSSSKSKSYDNDTTVTANTAQYNQGDAVSLSGINASGKGSAITLTDHGALKLAGDLANRAYEQSLAAETQLTNRMEALTRLAGNAVDSGIEAASANAPARAVADKILAYAKAAGAAAAVLAGIGFLVYLVKRG